MARPKMTVKQKRFCDEYIITGNATESALRAGYKRDNARQTASENLAKPYIREYIDERLRELENGKIAKADEVLKMLTAMMRGEQKEEILMGVGMGEQMKTHIEVSAKDRIKAAELLGKRYALFTDRLDVNGEIGLVKIVDDVNTDDDG